MLLLQRHRNESIVIHPEGESDNPPRLFSKRLTRAIVNPETLSNSVSRSDSHHEGIHTSTGYQAVVNHLLEKVMGQGKFQNTRKCLIFGGPCRDRTCDHLIKSLPREL